jgi:glycosyltransferase involved in cell wall biosynthesis
MTTRQASTYGESVPRLAIQLPFPLSQPGGLSSFVSGLCQALIRDFPVDAFLIAPDRFRGGAGQPFSQLLLVVTQLVRLIWARPDIVHSHEHPSLLMAAIAYRFLARKRVRIVHTIHVDAGDGRPGWKRVVLGWLLSRCSAVTAVSEHTARNLGKVATPVPPVVTVIRGGANMKMRDRESDEVRQFCDQFGIGEGPILCQMGPLNFRLKVAGILHLIEALVLVRERFPSARLVLVGDGRLRFQVEEASRRAGVADAVVITGYLSDVSLPLAAADVYCHISLQDACPISLLEAMMAYKSIVASRTGGIPEMISDGAEGLLVEACPQQVAEAAMWLLDHPQERRTLATRAAARARADFTWERVARDFAVVYGLAGRDNVARGGAAHALSRRGQASAAQTARGRPLPGRAARDVGRRAEDNSSRAPW